MNNDKHLLLFTIGPVQSFIVQARKTQDLFTGSQLLSHLIGAAIDKVKNGGENGVSNIIFPDEKIESKPNRFLAVIEDDQLDTANGLSDCIKSTFSGIAQQIFDQECPGETKPANFNNQIKQFLDINWVILPYEEKDYPAQYKEIERTLGAVKNTRTFEQLEEQGKKCSLCGERNVLFFLPTKDAEGNYRNNNYQEKSHIQSSAINISKLSKPEVEHKFSPGEGLCAVCFTKRCYSPPEKSEGSQDSSNNTSFPSTAGIALSNEITPLTKNPDYKNYQKIFNDAKYFDEQLLFEENLRPDYLQKYGYTVPAGKDPLQKLKALKETTGCKFSTKYYALILLDGDNMGKWLSGEYLNDSSTLESFHKTLSNQLGDFTQRLSTIIDEKKGHGRIVYAGGDDILAFVNLNHLLKVMSCLPCQFKTVVNHELQNVQPNKKITCSLGITIAHYKSPLHEVLKKAREAVEYAKNRYQDKDATAITFMTKSGNATTTVFKNSDIETLQNTVCALGDPKKVKAENKFGKLSLSPNFIFTFSREFQQWKHEYPFENYQKHMQMLKTELKRLMKRACSNKKEYKTELEEYIEMLSGFLVRQNIEHSSNWYEIDFENFIHFLRIAENITQEATICVD